MCKYETGFVSKNQSGKSIVYRENIREFSFREELRIDPADGRHGFEIAKVNLILLTFWIKRHDDDSIFSKVEA